MIINVHHTYVLGDKSVPNEACQVYAACHLANHEDTLIRSVFFDSIPSQHLHLSLQKSSDKLSALPRRQERQTQRNQGIQWHSIAFSTSRVSLPWIRANESKCINPQTQ